MALESATYISDLVSTNPTSSDNLSQGDDHLRLLKSTIKATFPNVSGAVTATHTELNVLDGLTASQAELNFVAGVTSSIQTQLNAKAPLASPTLTGVPAAPTAAVDTNTTQLATTAYVVGQGYLKSSTASSTYLTSATAASTYLTSATASSTYLTSATAASTYATIGSVSGIVSATTANVLSATAGATAGGVGTYAFMLWNSLGANQNEGATVAGSSLTFTMMNGAAGGNAATGTWRLMGRVTVANAASLFLRIS